MDTKGKFYLGRLHDLKKGETSKETLLYEPDDLTTHGVVFGMTGSGKTGLCISLLEEAALNNIPALMIDPKGDITNTLLHFPELKPKDFEPWINADEARREKKSSAEVAEKIAALWKNSLADWGITKARIKSLQIQLNLPFTHQDQTLGYRSVFWPLSKRLISIGASIERSCLSASAQPPRPFWAWLDMKI
jgi:DNA helicase HerA-like ATPase